MIINTTMKLFSYNLHIEVIVGLFKIYMRSCHYGRDLFDCRSNPGLPVL